MNSDELPALLDAASGRLGDWVYLYGRRGQHRRRYVRGVNPKTPAQQACQAAMRTASQTWRTLTPAQMTAWEEWAKAHPHASPAAGQNPVPAAYNAYLSLALKYLQIHPGGVPPALPPDAAFVPDALAVTAEAAPSGIVWTPSRANRDGVGTELLTQPLRRVQSRPILEKYRTQTIVTFAASSALVTTPLPPGLYAPAYRTLCRATGEVSPPVALVPIWVPG